jgi:hypothetical protein
MKAAAVKANDYEQKKKKNQFENEIIATRTNLVDEMEKKRINRLPEMNRNKNEEVAVANDPLRRRTIDNIHTQRQSKESIMEKNVCVLLLLFSHEEANRSSPSFIDGDIAAAAVIVTFNGFAALTPSPPFIRLSIIVGCCDSLSISLDKLNKVTSPFAHKRS